VVLVAEVTAVVLILTSTSSSTRAFYEGLQLFDLQSRKRKPQGYLSDDGTKMGNDENVCFKLRAG